MRGIASHRTILAVIGLIVTIVGGVGGLLVRFLWPAPILPTAFGIGPAALVAIAALGITWSTAAALLMIRRPENPVGRIMMVVGCAHALSVLTVAVAFAALDEGSAAGRDAASVAGALTALLSPVLVLEFYLAFIFPTGRGHTPRWDRIGRLYLWATMIPAAFLVLQPGDVHLLPGIHNPIGFGPDLRPVFGERVAGGVAATAAAFAGPVMILAVSSRFRAAGATERQQMKWFIVAASITIAALLVMGAVAASAQGPIGEMPIIVFVVAGMTIPAAIANAILRHHLYDIDRVVSRTIAYAVMTATLGATFAGAALILGTVVGSQGEGQTLQVAGATLLVVALFGPVRRRAQVIVDRRFDRSHYDAARTIGDLTARLRDDVDLDRLETDVLHVLDDTFHPADASVWLRHRATSRTPSSVTISGHRQSRMAAR